MSGADSSAASSSDASKRLRGRNKIPRPPSVEAAVDTTPESLMEIPEYIWQVRSGSDAKGPWTIVAPIVADSLEEEFLRNGSRVECQFGEVSYTYDLRAWSETVNHAAQGRPLRRVRWEHRSNSMMSPLGERHANGGLIDATTTASVISRMEAMHLAPPLPVPPRISEDADTVYWQFRGGRRGFGAWKWSEDSVWLERCWSARDRHPRVRRTYGECEYEFDFEAMLQKNLTDPAAPPRALRRWHHSWNLPDL